MNKNIKGFLIGICLGDGYLHQDRQSKNVAIHIEHSAKQKEYIEYKLNKLHSYLGGNLPKLTFRQRERKRTINSSYRFVKSSNYFRILRNWLYKNNIKTFNPFILNKLSPEGLALWIMDDGSLHKVKSKSKEGFRAVQFKLSICSSIEQCEIVKDYFKKLEIEFKIIKHMYSKTINSYLYSLVCNTTEYKKLSNLIRPYVIESMMYKLI